MSAQLDAALNRTFVGATQGLAASNRETNSIEQVYVFKATDDAVHAVTIEGWIGYDASRKMRLTKRQAKELISLLLEAVTS